MPNDRKHSGVSGIPTQLLVFHSGETPLLGGYAQSITNWGNTSDVEASWHWFVDPIAIVSMVNPVNTAWHASEANPMSEGFEQAGYARFSRAEWLTALGKQSIDNLAWLTVQRMRANGIPHRWLTTDEVEAVTKRGNRSIKGLCTHRQIDPETRTDPGDNYPFDYLDERIRFHMGSVVNTQSTSESTEEDDKMYFIVQLKGTDGIWIGDLVTRRPVVNPADLRNLQHLANIGGLKAFDGGKVQVWDTLDTLGVDVSLIKPTHDRVLGRNIQRYFNESTGEVRLEPFAGAIPARSTDLHDVLTTNKLINNLSDKIDSIKPEATK